MQLELIVPVLMGCVLIWWIGRTLSWFAKLVSAALALLIVALVLGFERYLQ